MAVLADGDTFGEKDAPVIGTDNRTVVGIGIGVDGVCDKVDIGFGVGPPGFFDGGAVGKVKEGVVRSEGEAELGPEGAAAGIGEAVGTKVAD